MRYPDTVADLRVPLLEISVMAYFLLNRTKHSESLRHGFSTRTHSQTRWHLNNDTARRRYFCTRAGKKLGEKVAVTPPPLAVDEPGGRSAVFAGNTDLYCTLHRLTRRTGTMQDHAEPRCTCCHSNTTTTTTGGQYSAWRDSICLECGKNMRNFNNCRREENRRSAAFGRSSAKH